MIYPLVQDLAAEDVPVRLTCGVLDSAAAYYKWLANPVSDRDLIDSYVTNALLDAHGDDRRRPWRARFGKSLLPRPPLARPVPGRTSPPG